MRVVAVVQARMGSSRLPGKVLKRVAGAPMLQRMLERLRASSSLDEVVVATTTVPDDEPIRELCARLDVRCVSGHPTDLLDRHLAAAREANADVVAKIPSDCPLIDPRVVDRVVRVFRADPFRYDYLSNLHPATYPDGNDVELMPMAALELAGREARRPHEREHTTPYLWDRPERFRIGNVVWETGLDLSMSHRFTVDYPEDHAFVAAIYEALWDPAQPPFSLQAILTFLESHPDVMNINRHLAGVNWYRYHLHELRTVTRHQTVLFEDA